MEDDMRSTVMSVTGALALLASVSVSAQTPPPDSVTEVLRQKPRQGMVKEYEASRKKHMAWHKAQNDTWAWDVFEITTGPIRRLRHRLRQPPVEGDTGEPSWHATVPTQRVDGRLDSTKRVLTQLNPSADCRANDRPLLHLVPHEAGSDAHSGRLSARSTSADAENLSTIGMSVERWRRAYLVPSPRAGLGRCAQPVAEVLRNIWATAQMPRSTRSRQHREHRERLLRRRPIQPSRTDTR